MRDCGTKEERSRAILQEVGQAAIAAKIDPGYAQPMMAVVPKEIMRDRPDGRSGRRAGGPGDAEDAEPPARLDAGAGAAGLPQGQEAEAGPA
jgi:hypothetical protein